MAPPAPGGPGDPSGRYAPVRSNFTLGDDEADAPAAPINGTGDTERSRASFDVSSGFDDSDLVDWEATVGLRGRPRSWLPSWLTPSRPLVLPDWWYARSRQQRKALLLAAAGVGLFLAVLLLLFFVAASGVAGGLVSGAGALSGLLGGRGGADSVDALCGWSDDARLPDWVVPTSYDLSIEVPSLEEKASVSGSVAIEAVPLRATRCVVLHAGRDLRVSSASARVRLESVFGDASARDAAEDAYAPALEAERVAARKDAQQLVLRFPEALPAGFRVVLTLEFAYELKSGSEGFYRSTYRKADALLTAQDALGIAPPAPAAAAEGGQAAQDAAEGAQAEGAQATPAEGAQATPAEGAQATPVEGTQATPAEGAQATPAEGTQATPAEATPAEATPAEASATGEPSQPPPPPPPAKQGFWHWGRRLLHEGHEEAAGEGGAEAAHVHEASEAAATSTTTSDASVAAMGATQFEVSGARQAFPCFDEPALKATFALTVEAPPELTVLSNAPIRAIHHHHDRRLRRALLHEGHDHHDEGAEAAGNGTAPAAAHGLASWHFERTPRMSTYLLAWIVGEFASTDAVEASRHANWDGALQAGVEARVDEAAARGDGTDPFDLAAANATQVAQLEPAALRRELAFAQLNAAAARAANATVAVRAHGAAGRAEGRLGYAARAAAAALEAYEQAFGVPYAFDKLDLVAVPDFAAGAMENWGLITFNEQDILVQEQAQAARTRRQAGLDFGATDEAKLAGQQQTDAGDQGSDDDQGGDDDGDDQGDDQGDAAAAAADAAAPPPPPPPPPPKQKRKKKHHKSRGLKQDERQQQEGQPEGQADEASAAVSLPTQIDPPVAVDPSLKIMPVSLQMTSDPDASVDAASSTPGSTSSFVSAISSAIGSAFGGLSSSSSSSSSATPSAPAPPSAAAQALNSFDPLGALAAHPLLFASWLPTDRETRETVSRVVAHEVAHQWFGNLATVRWWDDLWLAEGFASYVEHVGLAAALRAEARRQANAGADDAANGVGAGDSYAIGNAVVDLPAAAADVERAVEQAFGKALGLVDSPAAPAGTSAGSYGALAAAEAAAARATRRSWRSFHSEHGAPALEAAESADRRPLAGAEPEATVARVEATFDDTSYDGGAALLRQVRSWLSRSDPRGVSEAEADERSAASNDAFCAFAARYLALNAFGDADTADLWHALETLGGGNAETLSVAAMAAAWSAAAARPLVTLARRNDGSVWAAQARLPDVGPGIDAQVLPPVGNDTQLSSSLRACTEPSAADANATAAELLAAAAAAGGSAAAPSALTIPMEIRLGLNRVSKGADSEDRTNSLAASSSEAWARLDACASPEALAKMVLTANAGVPYVLANAERLGVFRTNYDDAIWSSLAVAAGSFAGSGAAEVSGPELAGLLDDARALVRSGETAPKSVLGLLDKLRKRTLDDVEPFGVALPLLREWRGLVGCEADWDAYVVEFVLRPWLRQLNRPGIGEAVAAPAYGLTERGAAARAQVSDPEGFDLVRASVLDALALHGDASILAAAKGALASLLNGGALLDPEALGPALAAAVVAEARGPDGEARPAAAAAEALVASPDAPAALRSLARAALASTPAGRERLLALALDERVRPVDAPLLVKAAVARGGAPTAAQAWAWLRANGAALAERVGGGEGGKARIGDLVAYATARVADAEVIASFDGARGGLVRLGASAEALAAAEEKAKANAAWVQRNAQAVCAWAKEKFQS